MRAARRCSFCRSARSSPPKLASVAAMMDTLHERLLQRRDSIDYDLAPAAPA
jgi:hypothetical protein